MVIKTFVHKKSVSTTVTNLTKNLVSRHQEKDNNKTTSKI